MVQSFGTQTSCFDKDTQIVHHLILSREVLETERTQRILIVLVLATILLSAYVEILFHCCLNTEYKGSVRREKCQIYFSICFPFSPFFLGQWLPRTRHE